MLTVVSRHGGDPGGHLPLALPLCGRPVTGPHKDLVGAPWLLSMEKLRREALLGTEPPGSRTSDETACGTVRGLPGAPRPKPMSCSGDTETPMAGSTQAPTVGATTASSGIPMLRGGPVSGSVCGFSTRPLNKTHRSGTSGEAGLRDFRLSHLPTQALRSVYVRLENTPAKPVRKQAPRLLHRS